MENKFRTQVQLLYSIYFPELLKQPADENEYRLKNPLNNYKNDLVIDDLGMFEAHNPPYRGFATDFYKLSDGIPEAELIEYFDLIKSDQQSLSLEEIKIWNEKLFLPQNEEILNYLNIERGLSIKTIKDNFLGYDPKRKSIVIPTMNITGKNASAIKIIEAPIRRGDNYKKTTLIGGSRLIGYHQLKFNQNRASTKFITIDEIDALYLRQIGIESYCAVSDQCMFYEDWYELFSNSDVVLLVPFEKESVIGSNELAKQAKSIKRIDLKCDYVTDFFVIQNKTIDDFNSAVQNGAQLTLNYFESRKTLNLVEKDKVNTEFRHGSQGVCKLGFYYGTKLQGAHYFLLSNRLFYSLKDMNEFQVSPSTNFTIANVTQKLVENYTQLFVTTTAKEVFSSVHGYIKKYIFLKDESAYNLLTLWIMGTYVFQLFRHFPYIHLQAEKNSGKTQLMDILTPISFNGKKYLDPTGSVIFRDVDANLTTMFLDESEGFSKRSSVRSTISSILNAGYTKDATISRTSGRQIIEYKVYCPKMFAGIEELNDVLLSRSIHLQMFRKLEKEHTERYIENNITLKLQESIREKLYVFGLTYAGQIEKIYNTGLNGIKYLAKISNRKFDVWAPLFILADIIDKENGNAFISSAINDYMTKEMAFQSEQDEMENTTVRVLNTLEEIFQNLAYKKKVFIGEECQLSFLYNEMYNGFIQDKQWKKELNSINRLTKLLNRIGIVNKPQNIEGKTQRCYVINCNEYKEFASRFGIASKLNIQQD